MYAKCDIYYILLLLKQRDAIPYLHSLAVIGLQV